MSNIVWEDPPIVTYSKAEKHECAVSHDTCEHCGHTGFRLLCLCGWKDEAESQALANKKWANHCYSVRKWQRDHPDEGK